MRIKLIMMITQCIKQDKKNSITSQHNKKAFIIQSMILIN